MYYFEENRFWGLKKKTWRDIIYILIILGVVVVMGLQARRAEANMVGGLIDPRDVQLLQCNINSLQKDINYTYGKYVK